MATYYLLITPATDVLYWDTNPFVADNILLENGTANTAFWQAGATDPPGVNDEWTPTIESTTDVISWTIYNA